MALTVEIKVVPRSGKQQIKLNKADQLVCYLKSPPERGLANKELIKLVAKALKIPQAAVSIVAGQASRKKLLKMDLDVTYEQLLDQLGIQRQMSLFGD